MSSTQSRSPLPLYERGALGTAMMERRSNSAGTAPAHGAEGTPGWRADQQAEAALPRSLGAIFASIPPRPGADAIAAAMRAAILTGRLEPGETVPPASVLAWTLNASLGRCRQALTALQSEHLVQRHGGGSYIVSLPPAARQVTIATTPLPSDLAGAGLARVAGLPLAPLEPPLDVFGLGAWSRIEARTMKLLGHDVLRTGDARGFRPLRQAVAELLRKRGQSVDWEQVFLVSSRHRAIQLLGSVLTGPGAEVLIEDPIDPMHHDAILAARLIPVPIPAQDGGLDFAEGDARAPDATMALVSGNHGFPRPRPWSGERVHALAAWARQRERWVVLDEADSELFSVGGPAAPLPRSERVVRIGGFDHLLCSALGLAWIIVPPDLTERVAGALLANDAMPPLLTQAALADFISSSAFDLHRIRYLAARTERLELVDRELRSLVGDSRQIGLLHMFVDLPEGSDDRVLAATLQHVGVGILPASLFYRGQLPRPGLVAGFCGVSVARVASALRAGGKALGMRS